MPLKSLLLASVALVACGPTFDVESTQSQSQSQSQSLKKQAVVAPTFALKTTDSYVADTTPTWKTSYLISTTYTLFIATEITGTLSGHHAATVFVNMPNGMGYQRFDVLFATDVKAAVGEVQAEKTSTGWRIWVSLPVAGTMIETSNLIGNWTDEVWIDSASSASAKGGFSLQ